VIREGSNAIHILEKDAEASLKINDEVRQIVNWDRRFDHMQQHSGQHLISALLDREFNNGTKCNYDEIALPSVSSIYDTLITFLSFSLVAWCR
jgi:Ser-tRNA(Ala) deacylase AlaX